MVDTGTITPELIDATADAVAVMHRMTAAAPTQDAAAVFTARSHQLGRDVAAAVPEAARAGVAASCERASALIAARGRLAERRGRHGFVRRCHGDLHLSNICVWKRQPNPFDAMEFDEAVATIDVLYDLAFVLGDLEARGRTDPSSRLLSRYPEATRGDAGFALLPLFKSQRAMVRALKRTAKGADPAPSVAMAGALGAVVIRSDSVRKRLAGTCPEARLGTEAYTRAVTSRVYRRMCVDAQRARCARLTVILDATFTDPAMRRRAADLAGKVGVPFSGVWLSAPAGLLGDRVAARRHDASDADRSVIERQVAQAMRPEDWPSVDASVSVGEVARRVRQLLGAPC